MNRTLGAMSIGVKQYNVGLNGSMILTSSLLLNLSNSDQTRAGFLATMRDPYGVHMSNESNGHSLHLTQMAHAN